MGKQPIVAFDFDGTLVDSYSVIESAFGIALQRKYPWLPGKSIFAKLLTRIEMHFERPRYGSSKFRAPKFFNFGLFREWFKVRAEQTRPIDNAPELLKKLKEMGCVVVSFSAEDFVEGMKVERLKKAGLYYLFDEVVVFGPKLSIGEGLKLLRKKFGKRPLVWVDDKPWRFLGNVDEYTYPVWYRFPITSKFLDVDDPRIKSIPRLSIIDDLWQVIDVVKNISQTMREG